MTKELGSKIDDFLEYLSKHKFQAESYEIFCCDQDKSIDTYAQEFISERDFVLEALEKAGFIKWSRPSQPGGSNIATITQLGIDFVNSKQKFFQHTQKEEKLEKKIKEAPLKKNKISMWALVFSIFAFAISIALPLFLNDNKNKELEQRMEKIESQLKKASTTYSSPDKS